MGSHVFHLYESSPELEPAREPLDWALETPGGKVRVRLFLGTKLQTLLGCQRQHVLDSPAQLLSP